MPTKESEKQEKVQGKVLKNTLKGKTKNELENKDYNIVTDADKAKKDAMEFTKDILSNAIHNLNLLFNKKIHPRDLSEEAIQNCAIYLRQDGYNSTQIGYTLLKDKRTIDHILQEFTAECAERAKKLDTNSVIGYVFNTGIHLSNKEIKSGNSKAGWSILKETIELLQSLGAIRRIPLRIEGMEMGEVRDEILKLPLEKQGRIRFILRELIGEVTLPNLDSIPRI